MSKSRFMIPLNSVLSTGSTRTGTVAQLRWTGGSITSGLAAPPHRNIQAVDLNTGSDPARLSACRYFIELSVFCLHCMEYLLLMPVVRIWLDSVRCAPLVHFKPAGSACPYLLSPNRQVGFAFHALQSLFHTLTPPSHGKSHEVAATCRKAPRLA